MDKNLCLELSMFFLQILEPWLLNKAVESDYAMRRFWISKYESLV